MTREIPMVFIERKYSSILPLCMVACFCLVAQAGAAERLIWDESGVSEYYGPQNIYSYEYPGDNGKKDIFIDLDTAEITDAPYYMKATFEAQEKAKGGAGFGFYWSVDAEYNPTVTNLSSFGGVCLNYSATNPVRMDFVQYDIRQDDEVNPDGDNNYFGYRLPSTDGQRKNVFVAFADLELGWDKNTSQNVWKVKQQLGLQFSYKADLASRFGQSNVFSIHALNLADECPQHPPVVNPDYPTRVELQEGQSFVVRLSEVFSDADGDTLSITAKPLGSGVNTDFNDTKQFYLGDSMTFVSVANPKETDSLKVELIAVEVKTNKKVAHNMVFKPIDLAHVPTVRDTTYKLSQGDTIGCTGKCSFYDTFVYDLDEDEFDLYLLDSPEFGEFSFDAEKGQFTYIAPTDTFGEVYFSLYAIETNNPTSVSDTVKFKINVLDINDPPTVEILDSMINYAIGDGDTAQIRLNDSKSFIEVDEDFGDSIGVVITADNAVFSDVDSDIKMRVKTNGLVNAEIATIGKFQYILVTAKKDANGLAKVTYYADDGEFQAGVDFYVKVAPVEDPPVAVDDKYDAVQDSTIKVAAKKGVLANDKNPDDPDAELKAKVKTKPEHGTLTLSEDGSFKYEADESFRGKVTFTYICVNADGVESEPATVTINVAAKNMPPVVREGIADSLETVLSTFVEDKITTAKTFNTKVLNSWFEDPDDNPMTFDAVNEDGKLKITVSKTAIVLSPAPDSCGESEVTFIATDSLGAETKLTVPVKIKPVNDAPVVVSPEDARYKVETSGWEMKIDLDTLVSDIDDDSLTYSVAKSSSRLSQYLDMKIKGSIFTIKPHSIGLEKNTDYPVTIDVKDSEKSVQLVLTFTTGSSTKLRTIVQPKKDWMGEIAASRGAVVLLDMQGRVMWTAKLPVSESQVRAAAAAVQGRKILRVNNQTWTIK